MPKLSKAKPRYCLHKASGQAVVRIASQDIYLGKYDSPDSRIAYRRVIQDWKAQQPVRPAKPLVAPGSICVSEVILRYVKFAAEYYQKNGQETNEVRMIQAAASVLRELYGRTEARDFGPKALKECQQAMIRKDWCRTHINKQIGRLRRMFKWAVSEELIPGSVNESLQCVSGLKRGRSGAREGQKVRPVSDADLAATMEHLSSTVSDMIQLQRFTGARPGEICAMRPCDINRAATPWEYVPESHKTEHLDRERVVFIGPKAQAILLPYLLRAADAYCFSPAEADAKRRTAQHEARRTPMSCGNRPGTNVKRRPRRSPGTRYTTMAYGKAIRRAIEKAGVRPWHPHQLRHTFATEVRKSYGLEAVQVLLGHSRADVSQLYAARDFALAARVAREVG